MSPTKHSKQSEVHSHPPRNGANTAIIWIVLITLFIIPLIFNYSNTISVFTELKRVSLHLGAGLILLIWLWQVLYKNSLTKKIPIKTAIHYLLPSKNNTPTKWAVTGLDIWKCRVKPSTGKFWKSD